MIENNVTLNLISKYILLMDVIVIFSKFIWFKLIVLHKKNFTV